MAEEPLFWVVVTVMLLAMQTVTFCGVAYVVCCCIKLKRVLNMLLRKLTAMDCDEILAAYRQMTPGTYAGRPWYRCLT